MEDTQTETKYGGVSPQECSFERNAYTNLKQDVFGVDKHYSNAKSERLDVQADQILIDEATKTDSGLTKKVKGLLMKYQLMNPLSYFKNLNADSEQVREKLEVEYAKSEVALSDMNNKLEQYLAKRDTAGQLYRMTQNGYAVITSEITALKDSLKSPPEGKTSADIRKDIRAKTELVNDLKLNSERVKYEIWKNRKDIRLYSKGAEAASDMMDVILRQLGNTRITTEVGLVYEPIVGNANRLSRVIDDADIITKKQESASGVMYDAFGKKLQGIYERFTGQTKSAKNEFKESDSLSAAKDSFRQQKDEREADLEAYIEQFENDPSMI